MIKITHKHIKDGKPKEIGAQPNLLHKSLKNSLETLGVPKLV